MKSADIAKSEYYEGSGTDMPTHDAPPQKRHPTKLRRTHSDSELGRIEAAKKRKPRKSDSKAGLYY